MSVATETGLAPWSDWRATDYLSEYYGEVMADERFALEWLVESAQKLESVSIACDFGCGPTVHHLFPLAEKVGEWHLAEYLEDNRAAVEKWVAHDEDAHDWTPFARTVLELQGAGATEAAIDEMEGKVRERITQVSPGDAGQTDPLGPEKRGSYPLVTSHYCAEGATNSKTEWALFMENIASLVAPGGTLILSACGAANFYCVGDRRFPCAGVSGQDVLDWLAQNGFGDIDLRVRQVPDHSEQGYSSVIFARAVRK